MARKWDNSTFIKAFCEGTLGRKTVHGSLFLVEGEECDVIVHRRKGRVAAIKFSELVLLSNDFENPWDYSDDPQPSYVRSVTPSLYTNKDYTTSRIVEIGKAKVGGIPCIAALIDLAGEYWLLDSQSGPTTKDYAVDLMNGLYSAGNRKNLSYSTLREVSVIHDTISEARESLIPKEVVANCQNSYLWRGHWLVDMGSKFEPPALSNKVQETLAKGRPHPYQFDISTLNGLSRHGATNSYYIDDYNTPTLIGDAMAKLTKFKKAIQEYSDMESQWWGSTTSEWLDDRYIQMITGETSRSNDGDYIKGSFYYGRSRGWGWRGRNTGQVVPEVILANWHKLLRNK